MPSFQDDSSGISHERWVELAQARNQEAFTILFEHHKVGVYRYIASIVGNREDAHDLTQTAFMKAWQKLPSLQDVSRFKSWLYSIARNSALDHVARQRRASSQLAVMKVSASAHGGANLEESVIQAELIALALAELPAYLRECWHLQIDGFSLDEIAQILGISKQSARTYASNARKQLREGYLLLIGEMDTAEHKEGAVTTNRRKQGIEPPLEPETVSELLPLASKDTKAEEW